MHSVNKYALAINFRIILDVIVTNEFLFLRTVSISYSGYVGTDCGIY